MKQAILWRYHEWDPSGAPDYPEDMPGRMPLYYWYSKIKNWPPEVVDRLTLEQLEWFPIAEQAYNEASEDIAKEMRSQGK